ncbi:enhancer of filamentation 1-like isoform X3 [Ostrea edulis]|uniref:enhancer of filamentation 1-like isoform X3 n=1 Tax=Ostrea edulis TaxID=37623 RepID=UPI0024AFE675|nr:enhancer of filamentation 1-like isoform X3 [Ostrea edulis]
MTAHQILLAKALYDNIAETPDELAFRRGDVLTVIEQDANGLEGWWLCSYRGRQGIAPGNRLKLLSGMTENGHPENVYQTPPSSNKNWNRRSWDVSSHQVLTPMRQGDIFQFNTPPQHDYDVPPVRHSRGNSIDRTVLEGEMNYDTPPVLKNSMEINMPGFSVYDTPPSTQKDGRNMSYNSCGEDEVYDVPQPSSNRSSIASNISHLSNESTMTVSTSSASNRSRGGKNSGPQSTCDSARSSMDITAHDFYDVPPSQSSAVYHLKQPSADSGLDLYDSPQKVRTVLEDLPDYDVPKSDTVVPKQRSSDGNFIQIGENAYDVPDGKSVEHDIDDVYDVPRNNTLVRKGEKSILSITEDNSKTDQLELRKCEGFGGVYDIPPQVTRDSILSSKSDSSDSTDGQRVSGCSLGSRDSDIPIYDELPLDLDAAMDLMVKLQQDVQKATTKLSSFVSSNWRKRENLESKLYGIKIACNGVKQTFDEFLDFAQGTLANSARLPDRKLIHKLHKQLNPLQQTLLQIKICLTNLDENNWQVSRLVSDDPAKNDDLGKIANVSKDLTIDVRKLVSIIHGNSSLLFKRAKDGTPLKGDGKLEACNTPSSKPPLRPKSNTPSKSAMTPERVSDVQQRPLPLPPGKERPLPPTPLKVNYAHSVEGLTRPVPDNSNETKQLSEEMENLSIDVKEQKAYNDEDIADEYDYVALEAKDAEEHQKNLLMEIEQEKRKAVIHEDLDDKPVKESAASELCPLKSLTDIQNSLSEDQDICDEMESVKTPVNRTFVIDPANCIPNMLRLDPNDKQVLNFYSGQLDTHTTLLNNAIDAFFNCIECGQGPKIFISHSKFVVVSAHKLVYIGDNLHRNILHNEVKTKIMHCANHLCEALKLTVKATKTAALQYPSVPVVQEMVDRVVDVSHAAYELKTVIGQASAL